MTSAHTGTALWVTICHGGISATYSVQGSWPVMSPKPHGPYSSNQHIYTRAFSTPLPPKSPGRTRCQRPPSSHPPLTHRPMSEQTLESAATAAWAKALGPQWAWRRERTTASTVIVSANPSPSRTKLTVALWPWAMFQWFRETDGR